MRLVKKILLLSFLLIGVMGSLNLVFAQTGTIRGEVKDAQTGEALIGANVLVKGTGKGAATDADGRYVIRNVPVGDYTLLFRYIGYETQQYEITLEEGQTLEKSVKMTGKTVEGQEVTVTAYQKGQSRALSEQRKSANIKNVISSEQIEAFAVSTVTGALSKIPGMGHGGANIRGVGAGHANVTLDGQRMGTTGSDRSVDLSTISADMVQDLEVIKVITPDMSADALAGVININTRRPIGGERTVNARIGGGFQDRYVRFAGTQQRASLSYGDSPNDHFSYGLNFSYQRDPSTSETFRTQWDSRCFEACDENPVPQDILSDVGNELEFNIRDRYGAGMQFTFQPNQMSTYHVQAMFNMEKRHDKIYSITYNPKMSNYTAQTRTGWPNRPPGPDAANQSTLGYHPRMDVGTVQQTTLQFGGRHRLDNFDLEYKIGWGHGRFEEDQYRMNFETNSRYEFMFNLDDRWSPTVKVAPWSIVPNFPQQSQMIFQTMDQRINQDVDNNIDSDIDLTIPLEYGKIKTGVSATLNYKRGTGERFERGYSSRLGVNNFQLIENGSWQVLNRSDATYSIPWLIDLDKAKEFYINQYPRFPADNETIDEWVQSTQTQKYDANENTYAAYAMGNLKFGWFSLIGGLRVENTQTTYTGREATIDQSGQFLGAHDITSKNNYINFFPNFQTIFHLSDMTNIRLAYSRSIGRPTFNQLNPYILRNYDSETIEQGNPDLKPMLSNNYDLMFAHYFTNVGQITAGLFYKDMRDFVYSYSERIKGSDNTDGGDNQDNEFAGWERNGYRNGKKATVYGFEFTWQQNLEFLPGAFKHLGTYVSYSYAQSIADLNRTDEQSTHGLAQFLDMIGYNVSDDYLHTTPLAQQRPHIVNVGLDYEYKDFFAQATFQYRAAAISSYGSNDKRLVPIYGDVYYDEYNGSSRDLSFTFRYWIFPKFQVWLDATNILNNKVGDYYYRKDRYPANTSLSGREIKVGLRYRL